MGPHSSAGLEHVATNHDVAGSSPAGGAICAMCNREVTVLTKHHLIPKSRGGQKKETILLCLSCKDMIHRLFDNKSLEHNLNTLEKLLEHPDIVRYVSWVKKQKREHITMALKKRR